VRQNTILAHLFRYAMEGHPVRAGEDIQTLSTLPADQQEAVLALFEEIGTDFLKPVFDRLKGTVSYDDLRILRLIFFSASSNES